MPTTDLLQTFGLSKNPFTDRTAENTAHDATSLYVHSDLRGFAPNESTYVFFGRRGSGKTTIRLQMEDAYARYNADALAAGRSRGFFVVDIARPGHLTACLAAFQEAIGASADNWDAAFQDNWTSSDMADCVLCYAATTLVEQLLAGGPGARQLLLSLRADPRLGHQLLLLAHLYARADARALAWLRAALLRPKLTAAQAAAAVGGGLALLGGAAAAARSPAVADAIVAPLEAAWDAVRAAAAVGAEAAVPPLRTHPKLVIAAASTLALGAAAAWRRFSAAASLARAEALQSKIRVVRPQPPAVAAALIDALFSPHDSPAAIQALCIGTSVHQKLAGLRRLVAGLGWEGLAVFGDCFDEVTLLDPVRFPGAMKAFAREVCRNDLLSFGRLHFFFPDSRLGLDLNTDKTLKEARFDRHFVRDLTWSRHQLEELAERRFRAAQDELQRAAGGAGGGGGNGGPDSSSGALMNGGGGGAGGGADANGNGAGAAAAVPRGVSFADLFRKVRGEDFSSYLSKLSTPRELLIMMTEMLARVEAHPEGGLTAQDMELAVMRALEQSV